LPEVWSRETQRATEATLVLANLVKRFDSEVQEGGDTLNVPIVSNLSANAKAANTQVTLNAPTEDDFNLSINRHFEASYLVEDRLKAQSAYNMLQEYAQKAGYAVSVQIDSDIAGLYSGLSQNVGNSTTDITDANITRAIQYLDDANAPQTERYFALKPAGLAHIRQILKFSQFDSLGIAPAVAAPTVVRNSQRAAPTTGRPQLSANSQRSALVGTAFAKVAMRVSKWRFCSASTSAWRMVSRVVGMLG